MTSRGVTPGKRFRSSREDVEGELESENYDIDVQYYDTGSYENEPSVYQNKYQSQLHPESGIQYQPNYQNQMQHLQRSGFDRAPYEEPGVNVTYASPPRNYLRNPLEQLSQTTNTEETAILSEQHSPTHSPPVVVKKRCPWSTQENGRKVCVVR